MYVVRTVGCRDRIQGELMSTDVERGFIIQEPLYTRSRASGADTPIISSPSLSFLFIRLNVETHPGREEEDFPGCPPWKAGYPEPMNTCRWRRSSAEAAEPPRAGTPLTFVNSCLLSNSQSSCPSVTSWRESFRRARPTAARRNERNGTAHSAPFLTALRRH